jgi:hypothetical protein
MTNPPIPNPRSRPPIPRTTLTWLLQTILQVPRKWLVVSGLFAFLSLFEVNWTQETGFSFIFRVTNTTLLFLALVWLPALLQVFALVGGMIRTPAGEFTSPGIEQLLHLLDSETKDEALGALKVVLERAEERTPTPDELYQVRQKLNEEYILPLSTEQVRRELSHMANRYQELRESPSGARRNFLIEAIAGIMRTLTPKAQLSVEEVKTHLRSNHQGQRLVGLSFLESASADVGHFEEVLKLVDQPQSAFEQYHALQALEKMLPDLNSKEKQRIREVMHSQRQYSQGKQQWIKPHSDRWYLSDRLLAAIGGSPES